MHLKQLKLSGFKSFADPTTIEFPSALCGIVGPNGCGKSNVIDAIREQNISADAIYSCGPIPMLRGVKQYGLEQGIATQISMEEKMACGVGACLACVCQSKDVDSHSHVHNKRICKDGPVFLSTEVEL